MARQRRMAAQVAAASIRTPVPALPDLSDEEMADPVADEQTPQEEEGGDEDAEVDQDDEDQATTPARDSPDPSQSNTPRRSGRASSLLPKVRRRLGRPPKIRPPEDEEKGETNSDAGTPRRGRGGFRGNRGGRWKKAGGVQHAQVPRDADGNLMEVVDDEIVTPEDPEGETKIDKCGHFNDGREYRVRTFTILGRGRRLYMLSTEPARCIGFRDSYLFFQKHKMLYKIIIDDEEKRDLIERSLIPHSYKGRAIGVVTARSVFREFGAKIIIGGKKVTDDYATAEARERGDVEGELAVPEDRLPQAGEEYNRNQYVAWHGASSVYHSGQPSVPAPNGKFVDGKRRKVTVTSDNWMLEHAREASRFNASLAAARNENIEGYYDIHTNNVLFPATSQPTHAKWEEINEITTTNKATHAQKPVSTDAVDDLSSRFETLDPIYARNFMIEDLQYNRPIEPGSGFSSPYNNQGKLPEPAADLLEELPAECRLALEDSVKREKEWSSQWKTETLDGKRTKLLSTVEWFP